MNTFDGVTYLTQEQFVELSTKGSITVGGVVYTYDPDNRFYITDDLSIDMDTEMSDTSENPVQNKVIKKYVDSKQVDIDVDETTITKNIVNKLQAVALTDGNNIDTFKDIDDALTIERL